MEAIFPVIGMVMGGLASEAVGGGVLGAIAAGAVSIGVSYLGNEVTGSSAPSPAPIPPPPPLDLPGKSGEPSGKNLRSGGRDVSDETVQDHG